MNNLMNVKSSRAMTYLRPHYVSTAMCSRSRTFMFAQQHSHACAAGRVQSPYPSTPRRLQSTTTIAEHRKPLPRQFEYRHQQQIASYASNATMPTPTASRVAIIGAGTVGATIGFSLIGMLVWLCGRGMTDRGIEADLMGCLVRLSPEFSIPC